MWVFICEFSSLEAMLCEYLILLTIPTSIFLRKKIKIKIKELLVPVFSSYQWIAFFKEGSSPVGDFLNFKFWKMWVLGFYVTTFWKESRKIAKFLYHVPIDSQQYKKGYLKLFFFCIIHLYLNLVKYATATLTYVTKRYSTPIITSLLLPMAHPWLHGIIPTHAGSNARGVKF